MCLLLTVLERFCHIFLRTGFVYAVLAQRGWHAKNAKCCLVNGGVFICSSPLKLRGCDKQKLLQCQCYRVCLLFCIKDQPAPGSGSSSDLQISLPREDTDSLSQIAWLFCWGSRKHPLSFSFRWEFVIGERRGERSYERLKSDLEVTETC